MQLSILDWGIIVFYLLLSLGIGLYFKNRAGKNLSEFFLGGRNMVWWLAGLSMVATTFAADTPLAVTELVVQNGISGNWLWWNMLMGGMLTTFFFARLWRRAQILTEVELVEFRYGGKPAKFLRGFKAVYLGLVMNSLIIGWVNLALMSLLEVFFDIHGTQLILYMGLAMLITALYSTISGLWGVTITDAIQFVIAMAGCIVLAVLVISSEKIGGISGLKEKVPESALNFFPNISFNEINGTGNLLSISIGAFLAYGAVQWWASWYPGAEPGGGGYVAQRMMSTKNEKHSIFATLFFQITMYALRPWPWILVALAALVLYPALSPEDARLGYVYVMKDFLPVGLRGLLLVAFLAAYMSTIATQLNFGASILTNDLLLLSNKNKNKDTQKKHVITARISTLVIMAISLFVTTQLNTISGVWKFIIECGAGLGLVLILRWYWWRINAWSEIAALITPFIVYAIAVFGFKLEFPDSFFITVGCTTITWIAVTFLTKPESETTLIDFYSKVKPGGWWKPIRLLTGTNISEQISIINLLVCWLSAVMMTYSILFFIGKLIFMDWSGTFIWGMAAISSFIVLRMFVKRTKIFDD